MPDGADIVVAYRGIASSSSTRAKRTGRFQGWNSSIPWTLGGKRAFLLCSGDSETPGGSKTGKCSGRKRENSSLLRCFKRGCSATSEQTASGGYSRVPQKDRPHQKARV